MTQDISQMIAQEIEQRQEQLINIKVDALISYLELYFSPIAPHIECVWDVVEYAAGDAADPRA